MTLNVLAWNIHGLSDKLGYPDVFTKLTNYNIILLSESWLRESSDEKEYTLKGYVPKSVPRCNTDDYSKASGGLIMYVKKDISAYVKFQKSLCDHFMVIRIENIPTPIFIIFSYILPFDTTYKCPSCDNNFYEQLYDLYITYSSHGTVYVCGDLNSRTASESDCPENYDTSILDNLGMDDCSITTCDSDNSLPVRKSHDTVCNKQGKLLLDFCKSTGLRIVNGRFNDSGQFTYFRLLRKGTTKVAKSMIDYLLVPSNNFIDIVQFEVNSKMPESDHCSISYRFSANIVPNRESVSNGIDYLKPYYKYKWEDSKCENFMQCLFDEVGITFLENFTDSIRELRSCDEVSDTFGCFIEQAAARCLTKAKFKVERPEIPQNDWYDEECKVLRKKLKDNKNSPNYPELDSEYNRVIQRKKRNSKLRKSSEVLHAKNPTDMWKKLKEYGSPTKTDTHLALEDFYNHFAKPAVENPNNVHCFDLKFEENIVNFMKTYKSNAKDNNTVCDDTDRSLISELLNSIVTEEEVMNALGNLKKGKSPGLDGLPIDIFINCKKVLLPIILQLLNYILDNGIYPNRWAEGLIDPQYKKGSTELPSNFRRISILPAVSKIIEYILNNRLQYVDRVFRKEDPYNGGFKKDSRTTDNIFILSSLIECSKIQKKPLYVCFVDFKRAFDCVRREFMFFKLLSKGYGSKVLDLIINMYSKTKSFVKWKGKLSQSFLDNLGVAQGGILSPYLFNSFLSDLCDSLSNRYGVVIDAETILTHLFWADDLILLSESADGLQAQIDNLHTFCSKWQMIINNLKTKVLIFNQDKNEQLQKFHVGDVDIEVSTQYNYLGMLFSTVKQSKISEGYIISNCRRALYKIRSYSLPLGQLPPTTGLQLFDSLIMPLMDYASELWSCKSVVDALEVFHLGYLKRILGVRPSTPTLAVYGEFARQPVSYRLEMNKLKYLHRLWNLPTYSITGDRPKHPMSITPQPCIPKTPHMNS